jgi:hypothetical protein
MAAAARNAEAPATKFLRYAGRVLPRQQLPSHSLLLPHQSQPEKWAESASRLTRLVASVRESQGGAAAVKELSDQVFGSQMPPSLSDLLTNRWSADRRRHFFSATLPFMAQQCALEAPRRFPRPLPYLFDEIHRPASSHIALQREQVATLLALAFFQMSELTLGSSRALAPLFLADQAALDAASQASKWQALFNYFEHLMASPPPPFDTQITIQRFAMDRKTIRTQLRFEVLRSSLERMGRIAVFPMHSNYVERLNAAAPRTLWTSKQLRPFALPLATQADAAILSFPELLVAPLIADALEDHEVLAVSGARRFSRATLDQASSRLVVEDRIDFSGWERGPSGGGTVILADAVDTRFSPARAPDAIVRNIVKSACAFLASGRAVSDRAPVAMPLVQSSCWPVLSTTVPNKDYELQLVLQWIAATVSRRQLTFFVEPGDPAQIIAARQAVARVSKYSIQKIFAKIMNRNVPFRAAVSAFDMLAM